MGKERRQEKPGTRLPYVRKLPDSESGSGPRSERAKAGRSSRAPTERRRQLRRVQPKSAPAARRASADPERPEAVRRTPGCVTPVRPEPEAGFAIFTVVKKRYFSPSGLLDSQNCVFRFFARFPSSR